MNKRHLGLPGTISIGLSAIVGGGFLALAGSAYALAGPSAVVAFLLNGAIAIIASLSLAEMASKFPESGGTYTFSKRILTVQAAFSVGWVVWFASIAASVLYALGFASFLSIAIEAFIVQIFGSSPKFLLSKFFTALLAILVVLWSGYAQIHQKGRGDKVANIVKISVFGVIILGGLWSLVQQDISTTWNNITPFFANGISGVFQAMGYTFIAFQGFNLIATMAGEIKEPGETIPKAMIISLVIALSIYIPILFLLPAISAGSEPISVMAAKDPAGIVATAVISFLGSFGFGLVLIVGIVAMFTAMQSNLFGASRLIFSMASDRTLPPSFAQLHQELKTPVNAILISMSTVIFVIVVIPDVGSAGAASSLIFLISFAVAQAINIIARKRITKRAKSFEVPFFPYLPALGAVLCLALAMYQGVNVPSAGFITVLWLGIGVFLYWFLLASRAEIWDASAEAKNPELLKSRGRSPLILVPVSNPTTATALARTAQMFAPDEIGRVLLLTVIKAPKVWKEEYHSEVDRAAGVLKTAITSAYMSGLQPEALTTVSPDPWKEIQRVAKNHRCEALLLGMSNISDSSLDINFQRMINAVDGHIIILRAPQNWEISGVKKVLVPSVGKSHNSVLRARLLSALGRIYNPEIEFFQVVHPSIPKAAHFKIRRDLYSEGIDEVADSSRMKVDIVVSDVIDDAIVSKSESADLLVMGMPNIAGRRRSFGDLLVNVASKTDIPILVIGN